MSFISGGGIELLLSHVRGGEVRVAVPCIPFDMLR